MPQAGPLQKESVTAGLTLRNHNLNMLKFTSSNLKPVPMQQQVNWQTDLIS